MMWTDVREIEFNLMAVSIACTPKRYELCTVVTVLFKPSEFYEKLIELHE